MEKQSPASIDDVGLNPLRGQESNRDKRSARLLLIEDDDSIAAEIIADMENRGYHVQHEVTGLRGLDLAQNAHFDIMVVDRMLPELDGLSVLETLRQQKLMVPVIILSALSAVDDRIKGLKAGGDDYLTKPFEMEELAARLEVLLRRPLQERASKLNIGSLEIDLIDRRAYRSGREIDLLPREFRLLEYMMRRPNMVLTRKMLLEDVWNYQFIPKTNLVDVHIGKLRRKVDLPEEEILIESVRGAGFKLCVQE